MGGGRRNMTGTPENKSVLHIRGQGQEVLGEPRSGIWSLALQSC